MLVLLTTTNVIGGLLAGAGTGAAVMRDGLEQDRHKQTIDVINL